MASHLESQISANDFVILCLGTVPGLPKIHFFGKCDPYDAMVMELLGPSLDQVLVYCNNRFSLRTTTMLAVQMLDIIQYIHTQKIIFCNVKPENFCLGHPCTPTANRVHLIGFNYAKVFETDQQKHIPKTNVKCDEQSIKGGFGTPRYMSLNAHKCKELSRRDDLESIGYLLLYFVNGQLPWQGMHIPNEYERYERIYMMKKTVKLEELCYGLPSEYYHYMLYVRTLKFAQEPNYRYLIKMFTRMLSRMNIDQCTQSTHFDWDRTQSQSICRGVDKEPSTPSKKQVSFKQDADLINIHSDMYFPFLRNTNLASVRNLNYPDH